MAEPLQITLFGEFSLVHQGTLVPNLSGDRPITLLAYLLLHRQAAVSRQHLAFTLWPDSSDSQARANLRNLFYTLRQSLPDADTYLAGDSMTLQWRSDAHLSLDVADFEAALAAAQTTSVIADKLHHLETAVAHYKGDLLSGNYDDWILPLREEFRQAYHGALHQLIQLFEATGDFRSASRYGQRLLLNDPLDESVYVQLMRLHALSGDRAGVRRVFAACVATLRRELDVEPGSATQEAYEQLLRLDTVPSLPGTPLVDTLPGLPVLRPAPLPVPATTFIGREAELAHVAELLAEPDCRLLTIVGPGGIGKTRLALQTAVGHRPIFADGVCWVSLTSVQTADHLVVAVAEALNYRLRGVANAEAELLHALGSKEVLLILDNFEHLLPAAEFLTRLLAQTTAVQLLVTSRQALEMQEEWRFELGELALPPTLTTDSLVGNSAIQLFIQSARRAASLFAPQESDFPAIAHICQMVGGLPLGIELAASWVRLLSCAEIAQEIEKSLDFLTVTLRNIPDRHRSLRAVFDYSWSLLSPTEQQVLARLSIFRGGFTRESAEQVAGADLPLLSALADRSLVQRMGVNRYNLHNVVAQYAADQLSAAPSDHSDAAQRHSDYYLRWLVAQDSVLRSGEQKVALTAVAAELANIRTAWYWAIGQHQTESLRAAAFPLFYFFELRGLLHEGEAVFGLAAETFVLVEAGDNREPKAAIYTLDTYRAYLGFRLGKMSLAETLLRQTVQKLHQQANEILRSHCLCYLGLVEWSLGHFAAALDCLQQSLNLARGQQDPWGIATAQVYLGMIMHDQGQLVDAHQHLTAVQPIAKKLGDPRLMANTLLIFGRTNLLLGNLADASQQLTDCLDITQETKDPNSITYATLYLGMVKQAQGDLTAARKLIQQSMMLFFNFNDLVGLERASVSLGFLEIESNNLEAAQAHFLAFLQAKQRVHAIRYVLAAVVGTAVVRARTGDTLTALVWTFAVLQHAGVDLEARQRAETLRLELEALLTPTQIAQAQQQAAQQDFAEILQAITHPQ